MGTDWLPIYDTDSLAVRVDQGFFSAHRSPASAVGRLERENVVFGVLRTPSVPRYLIWFRYCGFSVHTVAEEE